MRRRKLLLSDIKLTELLSIECNTFSSIATLAGVSRERIRQLYNTKFKKIIGTQKTGHTRTKVCSRKQYSLAKTQLLPTGKAAEAAIRAVEAGLIITPVLLHRASRRVPKAASTLLYVNGHLCCVATSNRASKVSPKALNTYWRVRASLAALRASFMLILFPHTQLVIPTEGLRLNQWVCIRTDKEYLNTPDTYPRYTPTVDWWQYENAWDQLKEHK